MIEDIKIYKKGDQSPQKQDPTLASRGVSADGEIDLPIGHNYLQTGYLFDERLYYKEKAFEQVEGRDYGLIDTWNTTIEYGKVDHAGLPIYLSEIYLKQFTSAVKQDLFAISFVVDLFEEMVFNSENYIRKAGSLLKVRELENQGIFPMSCVKAWESPTLAYHNHMATLYRSFTSDFLSDKHSKILTFEHFVKHFTDYCHLAAQNVPLTFSSFIQSPYCPVNSNGFTIEISEAEYHNDEDKFSSFFLSPYYKVYSRMAHAHGFMIDKNVPWRLFANLNHPKMRSAAQKDMMSGEDFTVKSIMNKIYQKAHVSDIEFLKFYMASFYNSYVKFMPTVNIPYTKNCTYGEAKLQIGTATRTPLAAFDESRFLIQNSAYTNDYNDFYWLNFYYHIKIKENKLRYEPKLISAEMRKIFSFYRSYGLEKTVKRIIFDINIQRRRQNTKRGIFTNANSGLIVYEKLTRYMPEDDHLHDVPDTPYGQDLDTVPSPIQGEPGEITSGGASMSAAPATAADTSGVQSDSSGGDSGGDSGMTTGGGDGGGY